MNYQFGVPLAVLQQVRLKRDARYLMMITTLGGPAMTFKDSIDEYRLTAKEHGFDTSAQSLPVSTASLFYTAETTQLALKEYYPHLMLVYLL